MNAELVIQLTVGGRPFWIKKKNVAAELTKPLTDADYDAIVLAAESKLFDLCQDQIQAKPISPKAKK